MVAASTTCQLTSTKRDLANFIIRVEVDGYASKLKLIAISRAAASSSPISSLSSGNCQLLRLLTQRFVAELSGVDLIGHAESFYNGIGDYIGGYSDDHLLQREGQGCRQRMGSS